LARPPIDFDYKLIHSSAMIDRRTFLQSLALVGATAGATYGLARTRFAGGAYIQMGTSVTAGIVERANITPAVVGDRLGMLAVNAGLHGACVGSNKNEGVEDRSLYCLVDAKVSGDWTAQNLEGAPAAKTNIARLKTADFSKATYLGLEYGTNDFHYDRPMGSDTDCSKETFKGALNYSIQKLLATYPEMRLFLITPAWLLNGDGSDSDEFPNGAGIRLKDYVDAMIRVAQLNHVPCLDMWRGLGVNKVNYRTFTFDGTHPTELGAHRRGEAIASFIGATF
jgi:lysophospholipase L1-like esterase